MSLFGIFHGWTSRKKGLFEKLQADIKTKIFTIHYRILNDYQTKLEILKYPENAAYTKLCALLNTEQKEEEQEKTALTTALADLCEIIKQDKISQPQHKEQLRNELLLLLQNLFKLDTVIKNQMFILRSGPQKFNKNLFEIEILEEGKIFAIEEAEIEKIKQELLATTLDDIIAIYRLTSAEQQEIQVLPQEDKNILVQLTSPNPRERCNAILSAAYFKLLQYNLKIRLFELMAEDSDAEVRRTALYILGELQSTKSIPLIEKKLEDKDSTVRKAALNALGRLTAKASIPLIEYLLDDTVAKVRAAAIYALTVLNSFKSAERIAPMRKDPAPNVCEAAQEFMRIAISTVKGHQLYREQILSDDKPFFDSNARIVRREFIKTGSETVLLGGKLVGQVIIRIISEPAFLAWKKAFEAKEVWQKAGFDYVPVEPILMKGNELRAYKTKDGRYRVYTKVLGPSLNEYLQNISEPEIKFRLNNNVNRIITVLTLDLDIHHGHTHLKNFCVEIVDGKPRLYIIDFDQAVSPGD